MNDVTNAATRILATLAVAAMALSPVDSAAAEGYKVIKKDGYAYRVITDGPWQDRIAWAFDKPKDSSDPTGLLLQHLRAANDIVWASYKPTHPDIAQVLNTHPRAYGVYDRNYCGEACEDAFGGNDRVKPVSLGIYKPKSKRKWFVMHHKFAVLNRTTDGPRNKEGVVTGSFNWNTKAAELNYENLIYIQSRKIADAYWREYERINANGTGNPGPVSDGDITAAFNDAGTALLVDRISAAKKSIYAAVWSISVASAKNPNPVYDALAAAVARGVVLHLITDGHKAKKRTYDDFDVIGANMPTKSGHMHHKFMVIDGEQVVSGSFNFVTKSFSGNDENVVGIKSTAMATSFTNHWRAMLSAVR